MFWELACEFWMRSEVLQIKVLSSFYSHISIIELFLTSNTLFEMKSLWSLSVRQEPHDWKQVCLNWFSQAGINTAEHEIPFASTKLNHN